METVDEELDVVIARQVGVAPQLGRADAMRRFVVRSHTDVQRAGVAEHPDRGPFGAGLSGERLALAQVGEGIGAQPVGLIEPSVEPDPPGGGPDAEALRAGSTSQHQRQQESEARGSEGHAPTQVNAGLTCWGVRNDSCSRP